MIVGIDASNLREGGGRTHLRELLRHTAPQPSDRVIVWGASETLAQVPERPWLVRRHEPMLDRGLAARVAWQSIHLPRLARQVDVVFAPGGFTSPLARPRVVMSRNMLPFEPTERRRFGATSVRVRLEILHWVQSQSFVRADGVIFLTSYARDVVCASLSRPPRKLSVIPHGVSTDFRLRPRPHHAPSPTRPTRLLYVSGVSPYKHQLEVIQAVAEVRRSTPVALTLMGPEDGTSYAERVRAAIAATDPSGELITFPGKVPFAELPAQYAAHDVFVFASSCENMPNILVEAMSSGLPIACARRGPMPAILGDSGVYFDPERPEEIARAIRQLVEDPDLRSRLAASAYQRASAFSWEECARATLAFLRDVAAT